VQADPVIVSKDMHDDVALRILQEFCGQTFKDRRHLALASLSKLVGVQQILSNISRLEISATTRGELDSLLTEMLTCIDIVLSNR